MIDLTMNFTKKVIKKTRKASFSRIGKDKKLMNIHSASKVRKINSPLNQTPKSLFSIYSYIYQNKKK